MAFELYAANLYATNLFSAGSLFGMESVFGIGNWFEYVLIALGLLALVIGSITDLKTHEVPDWLSYSFILAALGARLVYSSATSEWSVFIRGLAGFAVFFGFGCLMFYTGQWGGGDSKVLMGLGALFGIQLSINSGIVSFLVNALICGGIYGILFSIYLSAKNWNRFKRHYFLLLKSRFVRIAQIASFVFAIVILIVLFAVPLQSQDQLPRMALFFLGLLLLFSVQLWVFAKSVESACMLKHITPDKLTEGDWILKDISHQGKYITGPKDLGISKQQIKKLVTLYKKGKIKRVAIKVGIPFVPAFLAAFVIILIWGNIFFMFVGLL